MAGINVHTTKKNGHNASLSVRRRIEPIFV
jgi:hypothetical protein